MILADDMDSKIRKSSSFISFFFSLFLCLLLSFFSVCLSFFVTLISFYFFLFLFLSLSLHANRSSVKSGLIAVNTLTELSRQSLATRHSIMIKARHR